MCPGARFARLTRSTSKRSPMPRPASVNSRPRHTHSFTGFGKPRACRLGLHCAISETEGAGEDLPWPLDVLAPWLALLLSLGELAANRRLCDNTARADEVKVPRITCSDAAPPAVPTRLPLPPEWRAGAEADVSLSLVSHMAPASASALRRACCRKLPPTGFAVFSPVSCQVLTPAFATWFGTSGRLSMSAGGVGNDCGAISFKPGGSSPWRFLWLSILRTRAFSVMRTIIGPLGSCEAESANPGCSVCGRVASENDKSASRNGKRTGANGICQPMESEPWEADRFMRSKPSLPPCSNENSSWRHPRSGDA
mmetsp:Transcript_45158/g.79491  ORF Transcript_45158/g.79491 Transcript_45158/m.79491 type:complete len:311 (+) Transcript_45158:415-1347(+)